MSSINSAPRVWFVTGASSGIGLAMTEHALNQGDIVVATLRNISALDNLTLKYTKSQLLVLQLDVTRIEDISNAFSKVKQVFGRVDVVFNNAGFLVVGEVEATPPEMARAIFDVNFWGAINVAREAVRFMRDENSPSGGSIINISSTVAFTPYPAGGWYAATKSALNTALESMVQELTPAWNIKVTIVELGGNRTRGLNKESVAFAPPHPAYADPTLGSNQFRAFIESNSPVSKMPGDPVKSVARIYAMVTTLKELPLHFPLGKDSLGAAVVKGNVYLNAAKNLAHWSEDVAFVDELTAPVSEHTI